MENIEYEVMNREILIEGKYDFFKRPLNVSEE